MVLNMELPEIVNRLTGPIHPVGSTEIDNERYQNLKEYISLVGAMIDELHSVSLDTNRVEYSIKRAAQEADNFLNTLATDLSE